MISTGRVPASFPRLLAHSFMRGGGFAISLLGLTLSIVALVWRANATVPAIWVVVTVTAALVAVATTTHAALTAHSSAMKRLPAVRIAKPAPPSYRDVRCIVLLDPSDLFVIDAAVSLFFREEEEYEALLGIGRVATIQDNGLIQVAVTHVIPEQQSALERIVRNDKTALKSVIVKPHMAASMRSYFGDES